MRALVVVGLHEDGKSIVCEDSEHGDRFLLPADERLRAAARGDATRLGQIEIELESHMRPREIQARIRAGETVEQVAHNAGVPADRVERFAYPVLLERSRTAELAQLAHPVREDGPDLRQLREVVAYAFSVRSQDYSQAIWDAWRGDDGRWIIELHWKAGRSDNYAHWAFTPGAHGGTVSALDESAEDLLNPTTNRLPRTLRAIADQDSSNTPDPIQPTLDSVLDVDFDAQKRAHRSGLSGQGNYYPQDDETQQFPRIPAEGEPVEGIDQEPTMAKKGHPVVPSWEDVLLGVRSQRG
jgi:hypothetical protein